MGQWAHGTLYLSFKNGKKLPSDDVLFEGAAILYGIAMSPNQP